MRWRCVAKHRPFFRQAINMSWSKNRKPAGGVRPVLLMAARRAPSDVGNVRARPQAGFSACECVV